MRDSYQVPQRTIVLSAEQMAKLYEVEVNQPSFEIPVDSNAIDVNIELEDNKSFILGYN